MTPGGGPAPVSPPPAGYSGVFYRGGSQEAAAEAGSADLGSPEKRRGQVSSYSTASSDDGGGASPAAGWGSGSPSSLRSERFSSRRSSTELPTITPSESQPPSRRSSLAEGSGPLSQALAKAAALRGAPPLRRGGTEPTLPIASGVLLKRGRKLAQWTPRWYAIDVGGTMVCHKSREDVGKRTPLWSAPLGGGKVTLLPFERLEQELRGSGLLGFVVDLEGQPPRELFAESRAVADQWIRAFALLGACSSDLTLSVAATADGGGSMLMRKAAAAATGAATAAAVGSPGGSDGGSPAGGSGGGGASSSSSSPRLDEYGFRLEEGEAAAHDAWAAARSPEAEAAKNAKQHERWTRWLRDATAGTRTLRDRKHLAEAVQHGVPRSLRVKVWLHLVGLEGNAKLYPHHYQTMLRKAAALGEEEKESIEKDLHRTFPNHPLFAGPRPPPPPTEMGAGEGGDGAADAPKPKTPPTHRRTPSGSPGRAQLSLYALAGEPAGRSALRRVLLAYAAHNQNTGYCQALNYLSAMLLLVTELKEEEAFWLLLALCEQTVPDFYSKFMTGIRVEQNLFADFFKATLPRLSAHLQQVGLPTSIVTTSWFMCLFVESLPAPTLLRVWDLLLLHGPVVLLRVGLALLKVAERDLLESDDFISLSTRLQALGRHDYDADALLNVAMHQLVNTAAAKKALAKVTSVHDTFMAVTSAESDHILEQHKSSRRVSMDRAIRRLSNTLLGDEPGALQKFGRRASADFRNGVRRQSTAGSADELRVKALDGLAEGGSEGGSSGRSSPPLGATSATPPPGSPLGAGGGAGAAGGVAWPTVRGSSASKKSGGSSGRSKGSSGSKSVPGSFSPSTPPSGGKKLGLAPAAAGGGEESEDEDESFSERKSARSGPPPPPLGEGETDL